MKKISIIIPMYNEEVVAHLFFDEMKKVLINNSKYEFELVVVNDGSKDNTLQILMNIQKELKNLKIVNFSRNFGHEAAVAAGFNSVANDSSAAIIMDADLQDPPELISDLIKKWEEGYKVVNAKRVNREKDSFMKRFTAEQFYNIINMFDEKSKTPKNVGNYRLIDRVVIDKINELPEKNRVFRVLVPFVGFKTTEVKFVRPERAAGGTHYNYKNMIKLAIDSITSTTTAPLKFATRAGILISFIGFIFMFIVIIQKLILGNEISSGWISIMAVIIFIGGIQILFLGLIGEYIGRIFIESKNRPVYVIDEIIKFSQDEL